MAINPVFFNPKELHVGVAVDTSNVGTAASSFQMIETDSVSYPTFNDTIYERRAGSGSGVVVDTGDIFVHQKGNVIEVSVSGLMTDTLFPTLMSCALGTGTTSPWTVGANLTSNPTFEHGETSGIDKTLCFAFNGAVANDNCIIPGCVVTSLTLSADANDDGGRMTFDLTAQSRTQVSAGGTTYGGSGASMTALSNDYVFLGDYSDNSSVDGLNILLKSFSLAIENPVVFGGFGGSAEEGSPQTYIRMVPELGIVFNGVAKYDTNLDQLWEDHRDKSSMGGVTLSNHGTPGTATRLIEIEAGTVEELSWDEGDYLGLSFGIKARNGSTNTFRVTHT